MSERAAEEPQQPSAEELRRHRDIAETVSLHIHELRAMVADGRITEEDHDAIGKVLCTHIGSLIGLTNEAWEKFKAIITESREVHYNR
jgi:hypothetical protein